MVKTVPKTRIKVNYSEASMWVIPSLLDARNNLPGNAPERRVITEMVEDLSRKGKQGIVEVVRLRRT